MSDPVSPSFLVELAKAIEGAAPPSWRPVPGFRRVRASSPEGVDAALPARDDPTRDRLFDIVVESGISSPSATSDEDRFVLDFTILVRVFYSEFVATAASKDLSMLETRSKMADFVVMERAVIQRNIGSALAGVSSLVDQGAVFPPGLLEWRLNVTIEELAQ